jgi:hypothetical protein
VRSLAATDLALALDRVEFARALGIEELDPWQRDLLRSEAPRILLNCARQTGKSIMAALRSLHRAVYHPGSLVLVLAPSLRQSQEQFAKIVGFYGALNNAVPPQAERRLSLELTNGSRIITLPGTEKTIRGFSGASLLIVDEAARVDDTLYLSVRPMLAVSGGTLMMLSTPFGTRGAFYREWSQGGPSWERYKIPATECPRIPAAFIEEERRSLGEWWFRQEYFCEFADAETQAFRREDIDRAFTEEVETWAL